MKKVLFLDIDGVLNSNFWIENYQWEISTGILIDKSKVCLLAPLVKANDAQIILRSGWRFWFNAQLQPTTMEAKDSVEKLAEEILRYSD